MDGAGLSAEHVASTARESETGGGAPVPSRPTTVVGYDTYGAATHVRDASGQVTTTTYDRLGRAVRVDYPAITQQDGTTLAAYETTHYDAAGNVDWRQDRSGQRTDYVHDSLNRQVGVRGPLAAGEAQRSLTETKYWPDGQGT